MLGMFQIGLVEMEVPKTFIVFWLIVMSIVYTGTGYLYNEENTIYDNDSGITMVETDEGFMYINESTAKETIEENDGWWTMLTSFFGSIVNLIGTLFSITFFVLPHVPIQLTAIMNLIVQPLNVYFLIGIYPIISDVIDKILDIIDIITPDWL